MTTPPEYGWGEPTPSQPRYGQYGPGAEPASGGATAGAWQPDSTQPQYGQPEYGQPQYGDAQHGQPQHGQSQYGQPQYGQPQYGRPGAGPSGFSQFQMPEKPGIIPLRPLRLGEFLDGAFGAVRANPRIMLGFSAVVIALTVALGTVAVFLTRDVIRNQALNMPTSEFSSFEADLEVLQIQAGSNWISLLMVFILPLMTGLLITSVSRSVIGQKATMQQLWALTKRKLGFLLLLTFLISLATVIVVVAYGLLVVFLAATTNWWVTVAFILVGGLGVVALIFWIAIRTLLVPPVLVLENARFFDSIKRSWLLTRGSFWRMLGIYLLTQIIVGVVAAVVIGPATMIATLLAVGSDTTSGVPLIIMSLAMTVTYTITTSFSAAVVALLYVDQRMRREGLDVELIAAARELGN